MPIEIRKPAGRDLFDYDLKYSDEAEKICPGSFSRQEKEDLERMAIEAHKVLGLRHYSRSDFMIHPKRGVFILETNSLPGMTNESLLPKALIASGSSLQELLEHILDL